MIDAASLLLQVDSTQVKKGTEALEGLTAAGTRAEAATAGVGSSANTAAAAAARMAAQAQAASRAAVGMAGGVNAVGGASKLAAYQAQNLAFQINDVVTGIASGQQPMRVFAQQGGQFFQIFQQSGLGVKGFATSLLEMIGVLKVTRDAELAEEAANAAAAATAVRSAAQRAAGAIAAADTELALAQAAVRVAATSEAAAAAQLQVAAAHESVAAAAAQATVAENALAVAMDREAAAAAASAAATTTALGPMAAVLAGVVVAATGVALGFQAMKKSVGDSGVLEDYARSLGLSAKQFDELRKKTGDFALTFGDVWNGIKKTASDALDQSEAWQRFKDGNESAFKAALDHAVDFAAKSYGYVAGAYRTIVATWNDFPRAIGSAFVGAVNAAISEINKLMKASVDGINGFIDEANKLPLVNLGHLGTPQIDKIKDSYGKAGKDAAKSFAQNVLEATGEARAQIEANLSKLWGNIIGAAEERIGDLAGNPPKGKKPGGDHGLADALAQLDAQIKGQWQLAAAYQVSDAAAIKAEALQKAEGQAIRHKGQVGIFYEKELALAVAQRAADGGKIIADIHAEAAARSVVNDLVEQGIIPVQRMGQALEEQQKKRQLMAALAVAEDQGWFKQAATLREEIARLAHDQGVLNEELAKEAALRQIGANNDATAKLQKEIDLIGASNRARAVGLAQLEAEQFIKANNITDAEQIAKVTQSYIAQANATVELAEKQNNYNASLTATLDVLKLIETQTQTLGQILSDAFGSVGDNIGKALSALTSYQVAQQEISDWRRDETKKAGTDAVQLANIEAQAHIKSANAQMQAIGGVLSATKNLFSQKSAAYKAIDAVEKAYAAVQLARAIASIAPNVAAGAAQMFKQLGVFAFPAVAAMIAVMAGLGFGGGGSSTQAAPTSADDLQKAAGTGTVLGDSAAKSASIADSLALMAQNSTKALDYSDGMLRQLRSIASNIGNLAASVARQLQLQGGFFDTTGKLGTNSSGGLFGIGGLFSSTTTTSLYDQGVQFNPATVGQIVQQGITGATYQVIETIKKNSGFLGIGGSTKTSYSTSTGALGDDITSQINAIIGQLNDSVVSAAKVIGLDVAAALKNFSVQIGQISFKGLTGQQITDQLNAVFSKVGDQMAGFAVEGLAGFQKAGEGLFETLMRLAKDYLTVDAALRSIGMTFGTVGAASLAMREKLIDLAGGLNSFTDQVNFFYDHFLSATDKLAMEQSEVDAAFASLGMSAPTTIAAFASLVKGLNLSTDAGQSMFAALMQIAPAFYDVATAADQLAKKQADLQVQLLQAQGNTAAATALQRQIALAALDPSLRALQQKIYDAQDIASQQAKVTEAKDKLVQAYQRESGALQQTIDKFRGFAATLREFRDSLFAGAGAGSTSSALVQLMKQSGLANAGNEGALGGGLQTAAQAYLDSATASAGSMQDVQRARALVARYLDQAIGKAEGQASIAQKQLAKMEAQVRKLADINNNVLTVAQAIKALTNLMFPSSIDDSGDGRGRRIGGHHASRPRKTDILLEHIHGKLGKILTATETGTVHSARTARTLRNMDRGGSLAIVTDSDTPIKTTAV